MRASLLIYAGLFIACALGVSGPFSRAQTTAVDIRVVSQSLFSLIVYLQTSIREQAEGDRNLQRPSNRALPQGPINPALKDLGPPEEVFLSVPVAAQGLLNFNGRVVHEKGTSEWSLGTSATGEIATYSFTISALYSPFERQITGDHAPSDITSPSSDRVPRTESSRNSQPNHSEDPLFQRRGIRPLRPPIATSPTTPAVAPPTPPIVDPRVVEFLFASTRKPLAPSMTTNISYSGERGPTLTYGAASVRIPDDHKIGRIELPSSWSLFGIKLSSAPNERDHFVIKSAVPLSEDKFGQVVRAKGSNTALVFVHGFNTTFEDSLYRNAQIVWDLQFGGLSVLFTWASHGEIRDYVYDRESAYLAREAFITLLRKLKRDYGIEQVNVLAHSMGNLIALDALASHAQTSNPINIVRLVMAAPDVDRDQFKTLAPRAKAIVGGMTLYASSADRALVLSRTLAGGIPRAGDVPPDGPIILPNVETIDVTAVGEDIFGLNHNVFAASRDVMEDIAALLRQNSPPPRLIQIRGVPSPPSVPTYWRYVR
jgi:esterase/lipase superfamily enzyme